MADGRQQDRKILPGDRVLLRSDSVDFQRGELEWGTHNIYFDQYSYDLDVEECRSK